MSVNINDQNDQIYTTSSILTQGDTGGIIVAAGNDTLTTSSGQKPVASGNNGLIRYNTTNNVLEAVINGSYHTFAFTDSVTGFVLKSGDSMSGALGIISGTATAPGLYINGSTSSGLFSPGTNLISIASNGSEAVRFDTSANSIFNTKVGIGVVPTGGIGTLHVYTSIFGNNTWIGNGPLGADFSYDGGSDSLYLFNNVGASSGATAICWNGTPILTVSNSGAVTITGSLNVTGTVTAPTPGPTDNSNNVATTNFVKSNSVPSGTIIMFGGTTPPTGFLECNGSPLSTTSYANLFSIIGYNFGGSGGSFNLPDMRGMFARGWDHGAGVDPGRSFGSTQADGFASHTHTVNDPGHLHNMQGYQVAAASGGTLLVGDSNGTSQTISTRWGRIATTGITNNNTGISETRPKNVAIMYCIKT